MTTLFHILILLPVLGFVISLLIPKASETWISRAAFGTFGLYFVGLLAFLGLWIFQGHPVLNLKELVLFKSTGYEYFVDLYFDHISAVYAFVGAFLTLLVAVYSRVYLHREPGYKRFFNTVHFFFIGFNAIIFSGNLETLIIGWEILGISSFQLIAFYRDRYLPVRNAVKVYSIYRLGDIGLITAMWMSHHLWHQNITFLDLQNPELVGAHLQSHSWVGFFISLMILLAAIVKSAQLPFSSWLPRAMEGPTPSSAIFYGSLSVHLGVFLLLRTFPFWEHQLTVRILIAALGILTAAVATSIARVQSSIKSQIAYASVAQIGLIFIELALGWEWVALIHFMGNAFLRTYQLLVSPSVVSYLIREQFYNFVPRTKSVEDSFPQRLRYSLYMLSLKEWNLDPFIHRLYRDPIKKVGRQLRFLNPARLWAMMIPTILVGLALLYFESSIPPAIHTYLPTIFSLIGLAMVIRAFVERKSPTLSWTLVIANHLWIAMAISFNEHINLTHILVYLSGIAVSGLVGLIALSRLRTSEHHIDLDHHQGHAFRHTRLALIFFLACLGLSGFPITPAFIGEDLIFSHIHENQIPLAGITALSLIIDGLAIIRIYAKLFMGTYTKTYHEVAYKSS